MAESLLLANPSFQLYLYQTYLAAFFSHDMIQERTYSLIPDESKPHFHKTIGMSLVQHSGMNKNAEICTLAVDQINLSKGQEIMDQAERALCAQLNLEAGQHAMSTSKSNYEQGKFLISLRPVRCLK